MIIIMGFLGFSVSVAGLLSRFSPPKFDDDDDYLCNMMTTNSVAVAVVVVVAVVVNVASSSSEFSYIRLDHASLTKSLIHIVICFLIRCSFFFQASLVSMS